MESNQESVRRFERAKSRVEEARVRHLSDQRETTRLESELGELKEKCRQEFGVEPTDLQGEIDRLRSDFAAKLAELEEALSQCEEILKQ